MRISFKRTDGAYLFQHIKSGKLLWDFAPRPEHVLIALNESTDVLEDGTNARGVVSEMLARGNFSENARDIDVVETETIAFQNRDR